MRLMTRQRFLAVAVLSGVGLALAGCQTTTDSAGAVEPEVTAQHASAVVAPTRGQRAARQQPQADSGYYIEFRARDAQTYGHTYAMFGRLGSDGAPSTREIAGLHPASEDALPYTIGHFIPVPSETGPARGDGDDQYLLERYRIPLTKERYDEVVAKIRQLQGTSPTWHAVLYNCNAFVGDIARGMGLQTPGSSVQLPQDYIRELKRLNT
jgi:hypothetical protein